MSTQLCEQYRPKSWAEVIGQSKILNKIAALKHRGLGGRAYWISGQSGTGKTSIAWLLALEIADRFFIQEIDGGKVTVAALEEIENSLALSAWGKGGRAFIINESHGLRRDIFRRLLVVLERLPDHAMVIFTTTNEGQADLFDEQIDANPLLSRCVELSLARRDLTAPFAKRCREIATKEGLNGRPIEDYVKLARKYQNNMRRMLQRIDEGEMLA